MIRYNMFPQNWPQPKLNKVVEFLDSQRKPVKASDRIEGPYPYYGANGQQGTIDGFLFDEPLVLLAEDGGHFGVSDRTIAYQVSGKCWVNNHAHVLRPLDKVDIRYLTRVLESYDVTPFITGTTRGKLTKGAASRIPVPLPPLGEQQRIAAVLDQADELRQKRRAALAKLDTLLQATFLHMFGDPVTNPMGWEVVKLGQISEEIRYGTSQKCHEEPKNGELPILRIPNIVGGIIDWGDLKYTALSENDKEKLSMKQNDLLFVRSNGNPEYIGRCAVYKSSKESAFASYLIRARLKSNSQISVDFVQQTVSFPTYRALLVGETRTTAGNYNISGSRLKTLGIISPPVSLQTEFLKFKSKQFLMKEKMLEEQNRLDNLFHALQQRAFNGQS